MDLPETKERIQTITDSMVTADTNRWTLNRTLKHYDGKVYAAIFEMLAEHHLIQPTIIYEFPTAVSPLSKQTPDDPDWLNALSSTSAALS